MASWTEQNTLYLFLTDMIKISENYIKLYIYNDQIKVVLHRILDTCLLIRQYYEIEELKWEFL